MQSTIRQFFTKRSIAIATAVALSSPFSLSAYAVEPFTLKSIRVKGQQHTDIGTIFASLPFKVGDVYDDEQGVQAIQSLYATGLFNDVQLSVQGDVLLITVQERPVISSLTFAGAKAFKNDMLIASLRSVGIAEGMPFDKALADQAEQEIKRQYLGLGYYSTKVDVVSTPVDNNLVNVAFKITEGDIAKINEIRIIGNHDFSSSRLRKVMSLSSGNWLSWYTKNNRYSREKLNADLEKLRSFYLNRGYLDFHFNATQVDITPDKKQIALIIDITEGPQYILSEVELQGDYLGRENEFKSLVDLKLGKPYDASAVSALVKKFSEQFGVYGYAFAQVQTQAETDSENGTVKLVITSRPQRRVYVRHIDIKGNEQTRDEVIRREFRQLESAWYDGDKIMLSRDRVDRLGFFTDVSVETTPVPNTDDQVDVTMSVKEKPTGSLSLGAGLASDEKVTLNVGFAQENVFGSGNYFAVNFSTSKYNRQYYLSTLNPYFTEDGVSRAFDMYFTTTSPYSSSRKNDYYRIETAGTSLRFGVPFTEVDRVYFGISAESTKIKPGRDLPIFYYYYIEDNGERSTYFPFTLGWTRDSRDSAIVPTRGVLQKLNAELSLIGDAHYYKASYQYQHWVPLGDFTFAFNGEIGYGSGIGSDDFPIFKYFNGGGLNSVRGFESNSFGQYDPTTDTHSGGSKAYNMNFELYSPLPGSGADRTMRLSAFVDLGNVTPDKLIYRDASGNKYSVSQGWEFDKTRVSVGVGFSWISPLGPLKFSYAIPVRKQPGDQLERFQFTMGTAF